MNLFRLALGNESFNQDTVFIEEAASCSLVVWDR